MEEVTRPQKITNATPMGGVMALPGRSVAEAWAAADHLRPNASNKVDSRSAQAKHALTLI